MQLRKRGIKQWQYKENKKTVSNFLTNDEAEKMRPQIEERRQLQMKLRAMKKNLPASAKPDDSTSFIMNAITGSGLLEMAETAKDFKKRDCYEKISSYLYGKPADKVCLVYGLRRTGKTTLLKQLVLDMKEEDRKQTIYICGKVFKWLKKQGGLQGIYERNLRNVPDCRLGATV